MQFLYHIIFSIIEFCVTHYCVWIEYWHMDTCGVFQLSQSVNMCIFIMKMKYLKKYRQIFRKTPRTHFEQDEKIDGQNDFSSWSIQKNWRSVVGTWLFPILFSWTLLFPIHIHWYEDGSVFPSKEYKIVIFDQFYMTTWQGFSRANLVFEDNESICLSTFYHMFPCHWVTIVPLTVVICFVGLLFRNLKRFFSQIDKNVFHNEC